MRRARLRTAVNLAAAQNRRRQTDKPESQNSANGAPSAENGQIDTCKNDLKRLTEKPQKNLRYIILKLEW